MFPIPDDFRLRLQSLGGVLVALCLLLALAYEGTGRTGLVQLAGLGIVVAILCFSPGISRSRLIFLAVGAALLLASLLTRADWSSGVLTALHRGGIVIAVFTALAALRIAAMASPAIIACGRFLAEQKPGRRYLALSFGGHLFGLVLLYGSISLLGSLAAASAARAADPNIAEIRLRRMLLAIQRGFAATLCWSPIAFSMVIATTLVPGATWSAAALPAFASGILFMTVGWALDTIFKPRVPPRPASAEPDPGGWMQHLAPLFYLFALVLVGVAVLHHLTGIEVIGVVMGIVPLIALLWMLLQEARPTEAGEARESGSAIARLGRRVGRFVITELPGYRAEILLLFMAAFIGSLGSFLLVPLMQQYGPDLGALHPALILFAVVCIIPLAGQLGMNPLLSVSLLIPLLPSPEALGISPVAMVLAVTGGWSLCGTTSPFTASVLLIGSLGKTTARRVGLVWNSAHAAILIPLLALWAILNG